MTGALPPALELEHVHKRWRGARGEVDAVVDVTLAVPRGAFVALRGPSGGGKTTLLSLAAALERPTSGRVRLEGVDLGAASEAERSRLRRRLGFAFQASCHLRRLPVWENVTLALVPLGVGVADRRARAEEALARVGLRALEDERPERLSGGEQQRLSLARALVGSPPFLFADEPTAALDPASAAVVIRVLREEHARGATLLVATHDPSLLALATLVGVLERGRLRVEPPAAP